MRWAAIVFMGRFDSGGEGSARCGPQGKAAEPDASKDLSPFSDEGNGDCPEHVFR